MDGKQKTKLLEAIKNGRCVLILGPAISHIDGKPLVQLFSQYLAEELDIENIDYNKKQTQNLQYIIQRYLNIENVVPTDPADEAYAFYKRYTHQIPDTLKALARLPFSLVINTTPDDLFFKAMQEVGKFKSCFFYYNFRREDKDVKIPDFSEEEPVVYNLYGHYSNPDSLVLTESDRLKFVASVVKNEPRIPVEITSEFDDRKQYLFLGFDFEQWHLPLLFDSLNIEASAAAFVHQSSQYVLSDFKEEFLAKVFRFQFFEQKIIEFTNQLTQKYDFLEADDDLPTPLVPIPVFVAYSPEDGAFCETLIKNLALMEQKKYISIWHEGKVLAMQDLKQTATEKLRQAEIVLLLVSSDFLAANDLAYQRELMRTLSPRSLRRGNKTIVPIIVRSCDWEEAEFGELPCLPEGGKAISGSHWQNVDEAYTNVVEGIKRFIVRRLST
ncbi:MAG: SIR2 family protein [Chitinophagales bacterium]